MAEPTPPGSDGMRIAPHLDLEDTKLLPPEGRSDGTRPLFAKPPAATPAPAKPRPKRTRESLAWLLLVTGLALIAAGLFWVG